MLGFKNPPILLGLLLIFAIAQVSLVLVFSFEKECLEYISRSTGLVPQVTVACNPPVAFEKGRLLSLEIGREYDGAVVVPSLKKEWHCKVWWERKRMVGATEVRKWIPSVERLITLQMLWIEKKPVRVSIQPREGGRKELLLVDEFRPRIVSPFTSPGSQGNSWMLQHLASGIEAGPYVQTGRQQYLELFDEDSSIKMGPLRILSRIIEERLPYESAYAFESALFSRVREGLETEKLIQQSRFHYILFGSVDQADPPPVFMAASLFEDIFPGDLDFSKIRLVTREGRKLEMNVAGHFRFQPPAGINEDLVILRLNDNPGMQAFGINEFLIKTPPEMTQKIVGMLQDRLGGNLKVTKQDDITAPTMNRVKNGRIVFAVIKGLLLLILFFVITSLLQRFIDITRTERFLIRLFGGSAFGTFLTLILFMVVISIGIAYLLTLYLLGCYNSVLDEFFYPLAIFPFKPFLWASAAILVALALSCALLTKRGDTDNAFGIK